MECDETQHVYKIRVRGTEIEEWYSLDTHKTERFVGELWLKHLEEQGGFRARFAETFAQHLEVVNICKTDSAAWEETTVRQVTAEEVAALEGDERRLP